MTNTLTHASEAMAFAAMLNLETAAVLTPLSVGKVLYVVVLITQMANFMRRNTPLLLHVLQAQILNGRVWH